MIYTRLISSVEELKVGNVFEVPLSVGFRLFYYAVVATAGELDELYLDIKLYNTNNSYFSNTLHIIPNFTSDGDYSETDGMHYCSGVYVINKIEPFNKVEILGFSPLGMYKTFETSTLPNAF